MAEQLTNRVYRAVEGRGTGLLPLLPAELVVTLGVGAAGWLGVHLFVGLAAAGVVAAVLLAWRRRDRGRADYVKVRLRRALAPLGRYARYARDTKAKPFGRQ